MTSKKDTLSKEIGNKMTLNQPEKIIKVYRGLVTSHPTCRQNKMAPGIQQFPNYSPTLAQLLLLSKRLAWLMMAKSATSQSWIMQSWYQVLLITSPNITTSSHWLSGSSQMRFLTLVPLGCGGTTHSASTLHRILKNVCKGLKWMNFL